MVGIPNKPTNRLALLMVSHQLKYTALPIPMKADQKMDYLNYSLSLSYFMAVMRILNSDFKKRLDAFDTKFFLKINTYHCDNFLPN